MKKTETKKRIISMAVDALIAAAALVLGYLLFTDFTFRNASWQSFAIGIPVYVTVLLVTFNLCGVYRIMWRFANLNDVIRLTGAALFASMLFFAIHMASRYEFPRIAIYVVITVFLIGMLLTVCLVKRWLFRRNKRIADSDIRAKESHSVMIVGAGCAANIIIQDVRTNASLYNWRIKCIVDDDPEKIGRTMNGIPIVGIVDDMGNYVRKYGIDMIVFAIPSCHTERRKQILSLCTKNGCRVMTLPSIDQMLGDNVSVLTVREVTISDLLGREQIRMDLSAVTGYVKDKTVLVTGGGGSIGSELCRQIAAVRPKKLIIFDIYENNAYEIQNELKRNFPALDLETCIGSVRDKDRVEAVFDKYRPELVYHAAAHKHVPLMEDSPNEAVKNNVFGTLNVVRAADKFGVGKFVMISTDKAVNPTNVMGATKRICEMIIQTYDRRSETSFVAVRFGNVLGSNGSVIPLFKRQIAEGGPVTVTHPDIIRYFMTIPEAVSLVLEAGAAAKGGEIFVLDMGKPVRIVDLAENLIRLSGYTPYKDIDIVFTGLRPGEKLYEELLMDEEGLRSTENKLIHIGMPIKLDEDKLFELLEEMRGVMEDDGIDIRSYIEKIVPTYHRENKINS